MKKPGEKRGRGRPPEDVPADMAQAIIEWLYEGKSLRSFCAQPGMPKRQTIDDWRAKDPDFGSVFARAMKASADVLADMAQDEVEDATPETVQVAKVRSDFYMKRAACKDPSTYGTKAQVEHAGGVAVQVVTRVDAPEGDGS